MTDCKSNLLSEALADIGSAIEKISLLSFHEENEYWINFYDESRDVLRELLFKDRKEYEERKKDVLSMNGFKISFSSKNKDYIILTKQ